MKKKYLFSETKKKQSDPFTLNKNDLPKLGMSAIISFLAVTTILTLQKAFPDFNWGPTVTTVLTAVAAWLANTTIKFLQG